MRRLFLHSEVPEVASVQKGRLVCVPLVAGKQAGLRGECRGKGTPGPRAPCAGAWCAWTRLSPLSAHLRARPRPPGTRLTPSHMQGAEVVWAVAWGCGGG